MADKNGDVAKRLDVIIRLLTISLIKDKKSDVLNIYRMLNEIGLTSSEIGSIFGMESKNISSLLIRARKKGSKRNSSS